jgi:hypothetical protein
VKKRLLQYEFNSEDDERRIGKYHQEEWSKKKNHKERSNQDFGWCVLRIGKEFYGRLFGLMLSCKSLHKSDL